MEKNNIPRLALVTFTQDAFKTPFLEVEQHVPGTSYFTIVERNTLPVKDYISPNRREFYKIFHVTKGTGILNVGLYQYAMNPGDIAFVHPDEIMSWQTITKGAEGHSCLIHPNYFNEAAHLLPLFKNYPFFNPSRAVVQLDEEVSFKINQYFSAVLSEEKSNNDDKKQAILLHLQMILLEVQRVGKKTAEVSVTDNYRYIHGFLKLLESSFQIQNADTAIEIKTAAEFASLLNVHPNYLNQLVKSHTGKTLREHIQERLVYEAKVLLTRTDWDIKAISYVLGFSEPAAFTSFFRKKEQMSPSHFRKKHPVVR
jgi:AraC-like DNA-binding protein/quercetin dioxygenase-like cupin family protein